MAANWKMHFTAGEAARYLAEFLGRPLDLSQTDVVFFVPAPLLAEAAAALADHDAAVGAQNIHWEDRGPYTGEISGPMVAAAGASYCLVGHSERRQLFGENHAAVALKLAAILRNGLRPVLCVGERIEERRAGRARQTVVAQLRSALAERGEAELARLEIAYEPVWAIGTGETATPEIAAEMHSAIRAELGDLGGERVARAVRILYGGSVTAENAERLMNEPEIDGALVGGASLDPESFRRIVGCASRLEPA